MGLEILDSNSEGNKAKDWINDYFDQIYTKTKIVTLAPRPESLLKILEQSKTAKDLYDYVEKHPDPVTVVFLSSVKKVTEGARFMKPMGPDPAFILFNVAVQVYNTEATTKAEMLVPTGLVFLHELGHARQYLRNPARYCQMEEDDKSWRENWHKEYPEKANLGDFDVSLENENLRETEWPICDEMVPPFPRRTSYRRWCGLKQALNVDSFQELAGPNQDIGHWEPWDGMVGRRDILTEPVKE